MDLDAWARSVDVNVKGFLYTVAAAFPIMREKGGHIFGLHVADTETPSPLYHAGRAAMRVLLRALGREFCAQGLRTGEVRISDPQHTSPEQRAEAVRRMLLDPHHATDGYPAREVPPA